MSEKFTASNGIKVWRDILGGFQTDVSRQPLITPRQVAQAISEFAQHERDQELGRWRWPENPDYVVYPPSVRDLRVGVVYEPDGRRFCFSRELADRDGTNWGRCASAYFKAHLEPKPWHDARNGQLWLIRFDDATSKNVSCLVKNSRFIYNDPCCEGSVELDNPHIVAGRRVWPEGDDE